MDGGRAVADPRMGSRGARSATGCAHVQITIGVPPFSLHTFFWALQKKVDLKKIQK